MTDRELLELAAKAAGLEFSDGRQLNPRVFLVREPGGEWQGWNPLTNDGDALRLAVKLNLHIGVDADSAGAITVEWDFDEGGNARSCIEELAPIGGDDYAATRRAIVRAAAQLGQA